MSTLMNFTSALCNFMSALMKFTSALASADIALTKIHIIPVRPLNWGIHSMRWAAAA